MATTSDPVFVNVKTSILYGVFASHKSFIIGTRNLVKREYATWLAKKATGAKLPQELVDVVAEELYRLERLSVLSQWQKHAPHGENVARFARAPSYTRSHFNAVRRIQAATPGIDCRIVNNDRPHLDGITPIVRETVAYVHISAMKQRPRLAINLPPNSPFRSHSPLAYPTGGKGVVTVSLSPGFGFGLLPLMPFQASGSLPQDIAAYRRMQNRPGREVAQISRLLQCDGVEEAMRDWDAEAVKTIVDLLDLKMVSIDGSEPLKPALHIVQTIADR